MVESMTAGLKLQTCSPPLSMLMSSVWPVSPRRTRRLPASTGSASRTKYGAKATAIVLVHGWSCDRSYFQHQLESFSDRYTVVTLDLAGHGESTLGSGNHTIALFERCGRRGPAGPEAWCWSDTRWRRRCRRGRAAASRAGRGPHLAGRLQGSGSPSSDAEIEAFAAQFRADFPEWPTVGAAVPP